jgi:membrane associated rhomboid family serine protease
MVVLWDKDGRRSLTDDEFVAQIQAGRVSAAAWVCGPNLTQGRWQRAGELPIFRLLRPPSVPPLEEVPHEVAALPGPPPEGRTEEPSLSEQEVQLLSQLNHRPPVTWLLLVANALAWLLVEIHGRTTDWMTMVNCGALVPQLIRSGQYWRLVTAPFLHFGILHLLVNGVALYALGRLVENVYGASRFFILYLLSALGGSVASFSLSRHISAGSSGAIFGLLGAAIVFGYQHRRDIPPALQRYFGAGLLPLLAFNLLLGLIIPIIDLNAHLGGLFAGGLTSLFLAPRAALPQVRQAPAGVVSGVALLLLGGVLLSGGYAFHYAAHPPALAALPLLHAPELYYLEGYRAALAGRREEALAAFDKALALAPQDPILCNNIAYAYADLLNTRLDQALDLAYWAVKKRPREASFLDTLGWVYFRLHYLPKAQEWLEKAVRLAPTMETARYHLGAVYEQQGRTVAARDEYRRVSPQNENYQAAQAALRRLMAASEE